MLLIGPHVLHPTDYALQWARMAPIVKAVDDPAPFFYAPDTSLRIFRAYVGDSNKDVGFVYQVTLDRLKGYRHPRLYVEIVNEPLRSDYAVIDFAEQIVPLFHAAGLKTIGPNWPTGTPEKEDWEKWRERKWAGLDLIGIHHYWGNEGFTPWHALRFSRFWQPGDPDVVVTEGGRDRVEGGNGGWKLDGISREQYVSELLSYAETISQYPYVRGFTPFTAGPTGRWVAFDTDGLVDILLPRIQAQRLQMLPDEPLQSLPENSMPKELNLPEVRVYIDWAAARWAAGQDHRDRAAFVDHLKALGLDYTNPRQFGWPGNASPKPSEQSTSEPAPEPESVPEPAPPPAPVTINTRFGRVPEEVAQAIAAAWPPELWIKAAELSYLESSWVPTARNNTLNQGPCGTQYYLPGYGPAMTEDSIGLYQVNRCAHGGTVEELSDPAYNARKGFEIYQRQGWRAWYYSSQKLGLL